MILQANMSLQASIIIREYGGRKTRHTSVISMIQTTHPSFLLVTECENMETIHQVHQEFT